MRMPNTRKKSLLKRKTEQNGSSILNFFSKERKIDGNNENIENCAIRSNSKRKLREKNNFQTKKEVGHNEPIVISSDEDLDAILVSKKKKQKQACNTSKYFDKPEQKTSTTEIDNNLNISADKESQQKPVSAKNISNDQIQSEKLHKIFQKPKSTNKKAILGLADAENTLNDNEDSHNSKNVQKTGNKTTDDLDSTEIKQENNERIAFYLLNFLHVLDTVMENNDDRSLFEDSDDIVWINKFKSLPLAEQKLFVRLYHRKLAWLRLEQVNYPDISQKIGQVLVQLAESGFLLSFSEANSENLELPDILRLLPANGLKDLAKSFHINVNGKQKNQIICDLEEMCNKQTSLIGGFFGVKGGKKKAGLGQTIMRRACKLLGPCYKVSSGPRTVFNRVLLVFDVTRGIDDETDCSLTGSQNAHGQGRHQQLSAILMAGMKRVTYPTCVIDRPTPIFQRRGDLLHYETAFQFQSDVLSCVEAGDWKGAAVLCDAAHKIHLELTKDKESMIHTQNLPLFLRCFTAQWIYTRLRSLEIEILQRLKNYKKAVKILRELLEQKTFCQSKRGHWWERLALNIDNHLKSPEQALDVIHDSLQDDDVRVGHKLALAQRASKILSSRSASKTPALVNKYQAKLQPLIDSLKIEEAPVVEITGRQLPTEMQTSKSRFVTTDTDDLSRESTLLCSVEELALSHYRSLGYDYGIHGEGGTFSTLFCLVMWDIIFMPGIPDVFRTNYQTHPLDYHTDDFYLRRQDAIENRLKLVEEIKVEHPGDEGDRASKKIPGKDDGSELDNLSAMDLISLTWDAEYGKVCTGMNWERFSSFEELKGFICCVGGKVLAGIFRRFAKDLRHTRSGLPDLVVWNPVELKYKMVEVKGPGDRLFNNQKLWLHELIQLGANVEVCRVIAIGGKKLSRE